MRNLFIIAVAMIYMALCSSLYAQEFAYVTDSLQLRVYASASANSEVLQSIDSGDSVEVFATENGFSKVTTYDGTEGWVKSAFLVLDPPAKLLYYSVGEKNKELEAELEALKTNQQNEINEANENGASPNEIDTDLVNELKAQLEQQQKNNVVLQNQLDEYSSTNADQAKDQSIAQPINQTETLPEKLSDSYASNNKSDVPSDKNMKWLFTGSAVLLLLGLLLGVKISTWRMRKRLHGFSI